MINKIRIICVGKIKEKYLEQGIAEFLKRLNPFCKIEITEIKDEGMKKEAERFDKYITNSTYALDSKGMMYSSEEFSELLKKQEGELTFIIGGPDGIDESLKKRCKLISLSKMTLLHEMARFVFIEQTYRAYTIINNRKYHR